MKNILITSLCSFLFVAQPLFAAVAVKRPPSSDVDIFLKKGFEASADNRHRDAVHWFDLANRLRPDDLSTCYYFGAALNRTGNASQALRWLDRASAASEKIPAYQLERGWARLNAGDAAGARKDLSTFLKAFPRHAKALEFLGRAKYKLGDVKGAEADFAKALALDSSLASTLNIFQGAIEASRGNLDGARDLIAASALVTERKRIVPELPREGKPWRVILSLQAGHNDNAIALADSSPMPSGISHQHGGYLQSDLYLYYTALTTPRDEVTLAYINQTQFYEDDLKEIDSQIHQLTLTWSHEINQKFTINQTLLNEYSVIGDESFRNRISYQPGLQYLRDEHTAYEVSPTISVDHYAGEPVSKAADRDGWVPGLALISYRYLESIKANLTVGATYNNFQREGSDYDHDAYQAFVSVGIPLAFDITCSGAYYLTQEEYKNANSLSPAGDKRDDTVHQFNLQLRKPVPLRGVSVESCEWFVSASYLRNDSNISFFEYDQTIFSSGITMGF